VLVYQFATASAMVPWLAGRSEKLVVNYHNITPPEFMAPWNNHLALGQLQAQRELALLAPRTVLAVADSSYNEGHLVTAGFSATAVIPPSAGLDLPGKSVESGGPGREVTRVGDKTEGTRRGGRWLAVGRVSPNKALESTVAALVVARRHYDPDASLLVVGKPATASYAAALQRYVIELGLHDAVRFTGHASDATVVSAYESADVLVVMSEHEGFCVPVVEALAESLPVVAFNQGAVPEVLGDAGVLVPDKDPYALAAAISSLVADMPRRRALAEAGRRRLGQLDLETAADRFVDLLMPLVAAGSPM
jgi:glycosyltransferase involved in cell wall biosynthesis